MESEIKLAASEQCTGCGACKAICSQRAIIFQPDGEGFPTPVIEDQKCIKCGLCEKVCPALHVPKMQPIQDAYASQLLDKDALKQSTSGGLFTALSREVFRQQGVVYGCVWDSDYNAVVQKAENEEEMKPMRGSKYVWSWAGDTFPEIRKYLNEGRLVMFSGLPCQVAGVKNYLRKDYKNLLLVDFFCGGSPSPLVFQEYLKTITGDTPKSSLDLKFRDKEQYGVGINISYNSPKGRVCKRSTNNDYFYVYLTKLAHRKVCYRCPYKYPQRVEDITIGDYWGIRNYHPEFNVRDGVSILMVNSEKGADFFEKIKDQLQTVPTNPQDMAKFNNLKFTGNNLAVHVPQMRDPFIEELKKNGWKSADKKYLHNMRRFKVWVNQKIPGKYKMKIKKLLGRNQ